MKIINRYLIKRLCIVTLYTLFALLALYSFFDLMNELSDVGTGHYNGTGILMFLLLQMPRYTYEMLPLSVLIGTLLALSLLAANSELTIIKASGMSTAQLIRTIVGFGIIGLILTAILGEWGAPTASRYASNMKSAAMGEKITAGKSGLWVKEGNTIVNIGEMLPDRTLKHIIRYQYNQDFQLISESTADSATILPDGQWQLKNIRTSYLNSDSVRTDRLPEERWQANIRTGLLDVLLVDPDEMSVSALRSYITHLKNNHQKTGQYELAYWRKLLYPLACMVMALVALAFTPQSTRHSNMGLRLFLGICLGLLFQMLGRFTGFSALLYNLPPMISAAAPTVFFAALAVYLIRRQEKR